MTVYGYCRVSTARQASEGKRLVNGAAKDSHWGGDILGQSRWLKAAASGARPHGAVASERPPGRCA